MTCSARSFSSASSSAREPRRRSSRRRRAAACPRSGRVSTLLPLDAHQHLRGGADDRGLAELQEVHVGRRVHHAQRAVDGEGVDAAVRRVCCERTTWKMSPAAMYSLAARTAARKAPPSRAGGPPAATDRRVPEGRRSQPRSSSKRVEHLLRAVEGRAAAGLGLRDEDEPLAHVVEGHERAVEGEGGHDPVGRAVVVGKPLEEAGRVPGEVADGPAGEARQAGDLRGVRREPRPQRLERALPSPRAFRRRRARPPGRPVPRAARRDPGRGTSSAPAARRRARSRAGRPVRRARPATGRPTPASAGRPAPRERPAPGARPRTAARTHRSLAPSRVSFRHPWGLTRDGRRSFPCACHSEELHPSRATRNPQPRLRIPRDPSNRSPSE